jgi:hypothetical protein
MSSGRSNTRSRGRWVGLILAVVLTGAGLRLLGLRTELWMDEILSLRLVGALESPLGVFTSIHSDNNHYLNSLWLYAIGAHARWWHMRLASIVLGILLIPLAFRAVRDWGRPAALVAALLVGLSYPMIHYSSEARGYSHVLAFALLSWFFFRNWLRTDDPLWGVGYALGASLGFLGHLGFATVFASFLVWSAFDVLSARRDRVRRLVRNAAVQLLPAVTIALLYLVDVRFLEVAGGPPVTTVSSWLAAGALLVGDARGWFAAAVALVASACVAIELVRMFRDGESESLFFAFVLFFPLANGVISVHAYPRYYLTALLFALLLLSRFVGRTLSGTARQRWAAAVLLVAVVGLNLVEVARFLEIGRGQYLEAVTDIAGVSATARPTVAGNHDLGHILVIEYYGQFVRGRPSFEYLCRLPGAPGCEQYRAPNRTDGLPPEFFIVASTRNRFAPPEDLDISSLAEYSLMTVYPKYGLSGLAWAVYRVSSHTRGVVSRASPVP